MARKTRILRQRWCLVPESARYLAYLCWLGPVGKFVVTTVEAAGLELHAARYVGGPSAVDAREMNVFAQERVKLDLYQSSQVLR